MREAIDQYALATPLGQDVVNSCVGLLQNVTNYFQANNETLEEILRNSGKDYNDLGRYEDCTYELEDFHYILVTVPKAFPIPISLGLCVPKICTI